MLKNKHCAISHFCRVRKSHMPVFFLKKISKIFLQKKLKKPDQYAKRCIIDIENHIKSLIQHCERSEHR